MASRCVERFDQGGRNANELRRLHVRQENFTPNHPITCSKVERFQQTTKNRLRAQPGQPATPADLQALLDRFCDVCNHHRPHRSLPHRATPAAIYAASPKALPARSHDAELTTDPTRDYQPQVNPNNWSSPNGTLATATTDTAPPATTRPRTRRSTTRSRTPSSRSAVHSRRRSAGVCTTR
ncbi:integrase core domain-containing protein [Nonomuraea sp. NPDC048882]|uniref:integrase core domain-containing protein n=1 Tax=Nonomuraea sp. NPDC048882 TaxID=3154347 RepID=UPI0033E09C79